MPAGIPVQRHWIVVLENGTIVVDWGDGVSQDIFSGDFLQLTESDLSRPVKNDELEMLRRAGRVDRYDSRQVWLINLPERPARLID